MSSHPQPLHFRVILAFEILFSYTAESFDIEIHEINAILLLNETETKIAREVLQRNFKHVFIVFERKFALY